MPAVIDEEKCEGCGTCAEVCPVEAITIDDVAEIDDEECTECETCIDECPNEAIKME